MDDFILVHIRKHIIAAKKLIPGSHMETTQNVKQKTRKLMPKTPVLSTPSLFKDEVYFRVLSKFLRRKCVTIRTKKLH